MIVSSIALHVTSNVGVVSLVILSVFEVPVSLVFCISGAETGVVGDVTSIVTERFPEVSETFHAESV